MSLTVSAALGALAGVRLGTGAIYLIAAVPLVIAAMIASVIWRSAKRERASRALRSRLESPNPETRRDALDKVTDEVLCIHSVMLSELLVRETDPDVLDALAAAVARSKWEPTDDVSLVQLRRWVASGPVRTTSSANRVTAPASTTEERVPEEPSPTEERLPEEPSPLPPPPSTPAPRDAADVSPQPVAESAASTNGREDAPDQSSPEVSWRGDGLEDLVDKVREVLGDGVERVELVSIDGELLTSWSSAQHLRSPREKRDDP